MLRQQLEVAERERPKAHMRLTWPDRAWLALLAGTLPFERLAAIRLIVTPGTILRWHRDVMRRRWDCRSRQGRSGRPPTHRKVRSEVLRLARENESLGLAPDPRRAGRARHHGRPVDGVGDPQARRDRPGAAAGRPGLGRASPKNPTPAIGALLESVEAVPGWVDPDVIKRGPRPWFSTPAAVHLIATFEKGAKGEVPGT